MQQSSSSDAYEFIISSSEAGVRVPVDQNTRRTIRRQAMSRAAAARKQRGNWGQQNRRQHLILPREDEEEQAGAESGVAAWGSVRASQISQQRDLTVVTAAKRAIPACVPNSGYESMRMNYGFDLLDISALTTFHNGRITAQLLAREPLRLTQALRCQQWSYFSFLPSRYGHCACLDDAANCVAARLRQWMDSPSIPPDCAVLSLYSKSLNSLQTALNDPVLCMQPEVLCATAILTIYEVKLGSYAVDI